MDLREDELPDIDLSDVPGIEVYMVTENRCEKYKNLMDELSLEFCHQSGEHPFRIKCSSSNLNVKQRTLNLYLFASILVCCENSPIYLYDISEISVQLREAASNRRTKTQRPVPLAKVLSLTPRIQLYLKHSEIEIKCQESNLLQTPSDIKECWGAEFTDLFVRAA